MVITPQSDVILLKCPLELDEKNQLSFTSRNAQFNYFNGLPKYDVGNDFTYVRKDGVLRIPAQYDDIIEYNYVMYRNDAYSSKWFYAFIDNMEYVNDNVTNVSIKTDPYQTWQFDLNYKRCFVEREHTNDDTIGANTVPENVELGEYVVTWNKDININGEGYEQKAPFVAVGVTVTPENFNGIQSISGVITKSSVYNGIPSGLTYLFISNHDNGLAHLTKLYDANSKSDAIANMFVIPPLFMTEMIKTYGGTLFSVNSDYGYFSGFSVDDSEDVVTLATSASYAPTRIGGNYTPKNNKLLTYPYCYERLTNNGGVDVVYRWEDFTERIARFQIDASISQGMSIKAYPTNYLGTSGKEGYPYAVTAQKFPTCSWNSDFYLSWVNQQGTNLALQTGISVGNTMLGATVGAGMAGGNVAGVAGGMLGAGLNILSQIGNAVQKNYEAELVPPQARGNVNSGDINFSLGKSTFSLYDMSIKREYARIIDDYFSMFGYKTNRVKVPNVTGRYNWNYVKTISCYIEADIPQSDLQEIKTMFDNGLTIWHHANTFMDYSQDNPIS